MDSDLRSLELPAFELDCSDWLVATPQGGLAPEHDGEPVIAVLSTAVITETELAPGRAVLRVYLFDDVDELVVGPHSAQSPELFDIDFAKGQARYVVPAPGGALALVADFDSGAVGDAELMSRFERLMTSFRWAS